MVAPCKAFAPSLALPQFWGRELLLRLPSPDSGRGAGGEGQSFSLPTHFPNPCDHTFNIIQHLFVSETNHAITQRFELRGASSISFLLALVNWAIYFNYQTLLSAIKTRNEWP